jgi:protein-S-isoprenylcysteine O-methyltransferase Ste14
MVEVAYVLGFNLAVACAFGRVGGIAVGAARSIASRKSFTVFRFGLSECLVSVEPFVLAVTAYLLLDNRRSAASVSGAEAAAAMGGGLLAGVGLALTIWTLYSWRQLFVGHAVLEGQLLITGGAYGVVRHPVYLGGVVIWCGLSLGFLSYPAAAITALYVLPAYLLYIRSEEAMMLEAFGEQYGRYRKTVPMLLPRLRARHP